MGALDNLTNAEDGLNNTQITVLIALFCTEIVVYSGVFFLIMFNIYGFILKQGQYKSKYHLAFYFVTIAVIVSRIVNLGYLTLDFK